MRLVIEIDENIYTILHDYGVPPGDWIKIGKAIRKGKPLPKGYGDLIDVDKYLESVCTYNETGCGSCKLQTMCPVDVPTIVETNERSKEECR